MRTRFVLLLCVALASCQGFVDNDPVDGPYRLVAVDLREGMHLAYALSDTVTVERVPDTVFAAGYDANYIVAARHPNNDRSITEYYYVIRALDGREASHGVRGPFEREAFVLETKRLGLPLLTIEFPDLK